MASTIVKLRHSRNVLIILAVFIAVIGIISFFNKSFITNIYFGDQLTIVGQVINGFIVALFLAGIVKIIQLLVSYAREESAIEVFLQNCLVSDRALLSGVNPESIIAARYNDLSRSSHQGISIDHGTLASLLVARESTRVSLPKFIHNILILTGVFGTIVSLSLALLGASNLIGSSESLNEMNLVMHGMSTALSTTMTAIVCYILFSYFYHKLTDVQTAVVTEVESATTLYLLPRFSKTPDSLVSDVSSLVKSLHDVVQEMQRVQVTLSTLDDRYAGFEERLVKNSERQEQYLSFMSEKLAGINKVLYAGFRLPPPAE